MSEKSAVRTEAAPAPFQGSPYSQAIRAGSFVFVSGQLGVTPSGELVGETIEEQTEQTLRNISTLLEAAGCTLADVVSALVHLSDLPDGQTATVARVQNNDPELLRYLGQLGLYPGAVVSVRGREPFSGPLFIRVGEAEHAIGREVGDSVYVRLAPSAAETR